MRFILLLGAAVLAVVAGVVVLQWTSKNAPPGNSGTVASAPVTESSVNTVDVLVAREPIPMGTVIKDSMLDKQPWPENLVLEGFVVSGSKDANIEGKVARTSFLAREPLMTNKLANPNDPSFLAATLDKGMRAVTLATDAVSGVAGYVFPGDRVDVLLTHNVPQQILENKKANTIRSDKPAYTEVLISNAKVLAVNTREIKETSNVTPASITIEVDPMIAEKIRLGEKAGTLSLALRALKDRDDDSMPDPATLQRLTRIHLSEAASTGGVRIVRGVGGGDQSSQSDNMQGNAAAATETLQPDNAGASQ